ncbi:DUF368 domain-containing protein [Sansalvadorimonas verongulae]|uniref:DUF368 domain-containing protein n=1 Tax=Sansalvadorimonas verongulae TaxID=2172824 RepID=UPI001E370F30|nr:DUF368 domain-containing protein [Sansalvadorimonas verongulae]
MGAADVVPGVSGGTIAFITGIYDQLLDSLKQCGPGALKVLINDGIAACWKHINGTFLVTLFAGILTSVFTLARVITWALEHHPIPVWSFFFGLVLVSAWHIGRQIRWTPMAAVTLIVGAGLAWIIAGGVPAAGHDASLPEFFLVGALAICAMILPGISGSFILLLLGYYAPVMLAVKGLNIPVLVVLAAGCVVGLLLFSRFLSWLLVKVRVPTFGFLVGLMLGSLNKLWPWKEVLTTRIDSKGELVPLLQHNVSPDTYAQLNGVSAMEVEAVVCMLVAIVLVLGMDWIASRSR